MYTLPFCIIYDAAFQFFLGHENYYNTIIKIIQWWCILPIYNNQNYFLYVKQNIPKVDKIFKYASLV